jgi:hypothetical protein
MTTTRKVRLAALVAIANGVVFLSFAAPPCQAGNCYNNRPYIECVWGSPWPNGTNCNIQDFKDLCTFRCNQTSSCKQSDGVVVCGYLPQSGICKGATWRLECACTEGPPQ